MSLNTERGQPADGVKGVANPQPSPMKISPVDTAAQPIIPVSEVSGTEPKPVSDYPGPYATASRK
jgi:hypothetical protein